MGGMEWCPACLAPISGDPLECRSCNANLAELRRLEELLADRPDEPELRADDDDEEGLLAWLRRMLTD